MSQLNKVLTKQTNSNYTAGLGRIPSSSKPSVRAVGKIALSYTKSDRNLALRVFESMRRHVHAQYSQLAILGGLELHEWHAALETWPKRYEFPEASVASMLELVVTTLGWRVDPEAWA